MSVAMRLSSEASTSCSSCTWLVAASPAKRGFADSAIVSTRVFQAPQAGHCPCHFGDCPPHSVQV